MNLNEVIRKSWIGFCLRCPVCEKGVMTKHPLNFLHVYRKCPVCGVEFEKRDGESLGAMMLNLCIVELLAVFGFFAIELFTEVEMLPNAVFWMAVAILGPLLLYRHTRGVWIALVYLSGEIKS